MHDNKFRSGLELQVLVMRHYPRTVGLLITESHRICRRHNATPVLIIKPLATMTLVVAITTIDFCCQLS